MKEIKDIRKVYLIGIGGIGMSALARYFHESGAEVSGYDRKSSVLTRQLEESGIRIHYQEDLAQMNKKAELVIYTPAISKNNLELDYYTRQGFPVFKRSDVLQMIVKDMFCITVGGTHGKTTISTLIAFILRESGYGCNAFLGGISVNYNTNYWRSEEQVAVIEADEYDRSFLKLDSDIAVLTAMDADHLDVYGTADAMQEAYLQYTQKIKTDGCLIYKYGLSRSGEMGGDHKMTYSLRNVAADHYASNITIQNGTYTFDVMSKDWMLDEAFIGLGGMHNVENVVAAVAVAHQLGIDSGKIKTALSAFQGIKRRFEYVIKTDDQIFIDDYAHHPEELRNLLNSVKALFPDRTCTVIFQPHLYSRTRDLAQAFARELSLADEVILLPIYPAREEPIPGVESELIAKQINKEEVLVLSKEKMIEWIKMNHPGLVITAGAGDIAELVDPLKNCLTASTQQEENV